MMDLVTITAGDRIFRARFRDDLAPRTCAAFRALLPFSRSLIHARWSGEACWVPLGDLSLGVEIESPRHCPALGEIIFYPGGISEAEILVPYGTARFACSAGPLSGSPFLTIIDNLDPLADLGREALYEGARRFRIAAAVGPPDAGTAPPELDLAQEARNNPFGSETKNAEVSSRDREMPAEPTEPRTGFDKTQDSGGSQ